MTTKEGFIRLKSYDSISDKWETVPFDTRKDYYNFLVDNYKLPGSYNFSRTEYWRQPAIQFETNKRYTQAHPKSAEYKQFFLDERRKCVQGVIIDGVYLPKDYYWFLNYTPIFDKIKAKEAFPRVYDGQYHMSLYMLLAEMDGQHAIGTKVRQRGISLLIMSKLTNELWFGNRTKSKVLGFEDVYVTDEWAILKNYRDHLNEHTGWYRAFSPDEELNWVQQKNVTLGDVEKNAVNKGRKTSITGKTTKINVAKAVGGAAKYIYATEAGVYPNLDKVLGYVESNLKMGGVSTGTFIGFGSVGELKQAAPLKDMCFNPRGYNIRPVIDVFSGSENEIAFFYPNTWNYTWQDPDTKEIIECYDKDGNSDIEMATKYIELAEQKAKEGGITKYKLFKSQNPRTLKDAFDQRDINPFPTDLLKDRELELIAQKEIIVSLQRDSSGKIRHKFSEDVPVKKLKPNPDEDNRGAIIVKEFPIDGAPLGLYFAGVDPILNLDTSTSHSLFSITVYKASHERNGQIVQAMPVCTYTGRHKNPEDTYNAALMIIEWYNCLTAVESNVKDFTEWMLKMRKSQFLLRRSQLTVISEMMPNSTIREEIGVRMEGEFKKRCLEKYIRYLNTPVSDVFNIETGTHEKTITNVQNLWDKMFIGELLEYSDTLNTDRLVSNMLALLACESFGNRQMIPNVNYNHTNKIIPNTQMLNSKYNPIRPNALRSNFKSLRKR